jgi:CheY-like chemotaxis protein
LIENNKKLKIAKEKAVDISNIKTQFISTISHELRTPLYGVVGIVDILKDEHPELSKSTYIDSLKFSANYLLSLVNDVLQISKIENNKIRLENAAFNIFDEMNSILGTLNVLFKMNQNEIFFNIDKNIPSQIIGDKDKLSQIIINLLGNSLKFTKKGKITLTINLIKKEDNFSHIEFEVKDTGIGIALENQTKIFDRFIQINANNDNYQGSGLGLSIVKKLISLFESEIQLQSELGKGTTFNFTIKFKNVSSESSENANVEIVNTIYSNLKVLIVEDNKINQLVTRKILEKSQCNCTVVEAGIEALEILKTETFDLILMDINMPGMNGFETTIKIRQNNITTPIIALTAFSKHEIEQEAIDSGMNAVVIKPYKKSELYSIISELIQKNAD